MEGDERGAWERDGKEGKRKIEGSEDK